MPIEVIQTQPVVNSVHAAYRPVVLRVAATDGDGEQIPPVVYCDIYFNDIFYKTLSKTQFTALNNDQEWSEWQFDIQDAAQEYLRKYLGTNGQVAIEQMSNPYVVTKCQCKFRSSTIEDGLISPEETIPVQGTDSSDPVSGDGAPSNVFYIVNAALQLEDNQDLATHLTHFKTGTWQSTGLPLSHRPTGYKIGPADHDVFPILYTGGNQFQKLRLRFRYCGSSVFGSIEIGASGGVTCTAVISDPTVATNGTGYLVSWSVVFGTPAKYFVSTPAVNGGAPVETVATSLQFLYSDLPVGNHVVTVRPLCLIEGEYYMGAAKTVNINVGSCVPVSITPGAQLPDAFAGVAYNASLIVGGTQPFILDSIVKPAWMTIAVVGNSINFTGTPEAGDAGEDIEVSFHVSNCADVGDTNFENTIDVFDEAEPMFNSSIFNNTGQDSSNILMMKTTTPSEIYINFTPLNTATILEFYASDAGPVDIMLSIADITPSEAILVSGGIPYYGDISANHVTWTGVTLVNGMTITLT